MQTIQKNILFTMFLTAAAAACLLGCRSTTIAARSGSGLNSDWMLVSFSQNNITEIAPQGTIITLLLEAPDDTGKTLRASGFSGVNNYASTFLVSGNMIEVGETGATMMTGDEINASFERTYLSVLAQMTKYRIQREKQTLVLYLTDDTGSLQMKFRQNNITGIEWKLDRYADNAGSLLSYNRETETPPMIYLGAGGRLTGFTGVNKISASYSIDTEQSAITVTEPVSTQLSPPDQGTADIEHRFLTNLPRADIYSITGKNLYLMTDAGSTLFIFTAE